MGKTFCINSATRPPQWCQVAAGKRFDNYKASVEVIVIAKMKHWCWLCWSKECNQCWRNSSSCKSVWHHFSLECKVVLLHCDSLLGLNHIWKQLFCLLECPALSGDATICQYVQSFPKTGLGPTRWSQEILLGSPNKLWELLPHSLLLNIYICSTPSSHMREPKC